MLEVHSGIAAEFNKLRRENLWIKVIGGLFILSERIPRRSPPIGTLEATQFLLKDKTGTIVARLGTEKDAGTCLSLGSTHSTADANLCVPETSSSACGIARIRIWSFLEKLEFLDAATLEMGTTFDAERIVLGLGNGKP